MACRHACLRCKSVLKVYICSNSVKKTVLKPLDIATVDCGCYHVAVYTIPERWLHITEASEEGQRPEC
eukprot:6490302-Amphidinium_carterae.2